VTPRIAGDQSTIYTNNILGVLATPRRRQYESLRFFRGFVKEMTARGALRILAGGIPRSVPCLSSLEKCYANSVPWKSRLVFGLRNIGLVDYWKARGWPDLCRPTTGNDFECN
jgi:hypothetical protein